MKQLRNAIGLCVACMCLGSLNAQDVRVISDNARFSMLQMAPEYQRSEAQEMVRNAENVVRPETASPVACNNLPAISKKDISHIFGKASKSSDLDIVRLRTGLTAEYPISLAVVGEGTFTVACR